MYNVYDLVTEREAAVRCDVSHSSAMPTDLSTTAIDEHSSGRDDGIQQAADNDKQLIRQERRCNRYRTNSCSLVMGF